MEIGMAKLRVWDRPFPSHSCTRLYSYFPSPAQPVSGQVDWFPSPVTKELITPSPPCPKCPLSPNPNWWWVEPIRKCTFLSLQNNEIMIIYQIWKNNIKVQINTTTINNFKPIVSLNDSKLMQKKKKIILTIYKKIE